MNAARAVGLFERGDLKKAQRMGRSGKDGEDRDPNSLGVRFGKLVQKYQSKRGLNNEQLAVLVYKDASKTAVSGVRNGRYDTLATHTINAYRDAPEIPQAEIDAVISPNIDGARLQRVEETLTSLATSRQADQATISALNETIRVLNGQLETNAFTRDELIDSLEDFIRRVGGSRLDPILWPATLRAAAEELQSLRILQQRTNLPAEIDALRLGAANAIKQRDHQAARQQLEKVIAWTSLSVRDRRYDYINAAEEHARALASLGNVAFAEFDFERARNIFTEILNIEGLEQEKPRYKRSLTIAFTALIALTQDYEKGRGLFEEMVQAGLTPDVVTYSTLIALTQNYEKGRGLFEEMVEAGLTPNDTTLTTLVSMVPDFAAARHLARQVSAAKLPVGGFYCTLFARPIAHLAAQELLLIYHSMPFKYELSLENPIRQYVKSNRLEEAMQICLFSPHLEAAKKFYREHYNFCHQYLVSAEIRGMDTDNFHYCFGIAAYLNSEWGRAIKHLRIALERAYASARIDYIGAMLTGIPIEYLKEEISL